MSLKVMFLVICLIHAANLNPVYKSNKPPERRLFFNNWCNSHPDPKPTNCQRGQPGGGGFGGGFGGSFGGGFGGSFGGGFGGSFGGGFGGSFGGGFGGGDGEQCREPCVINQPCSPICRQYYGINVNVNLG